ncbi:hypothetical protein [Thalassoroseus pseudoceratinae]|uniref:hypothetical protein n=1 Tax=Thalassoroseus pseudoceratinae TaxID=2713176 RepID=UPI001422909D|nr:hypothetical protein [Thalassoroseus pseudoceratinae]
MRSADLNTGAATLQTATETLLEHWQATKDVWNDGNSRHLEDEHLRPLLKEITDALRAVNHLGDVLSQAERECLLETRPTL